MTCPQLVSWPPPVISKIQLGLSENSMPQNPKVYHYFPHENCFVIWVYPHCQMTIPSWKTAEASYRQLGGIPLIHFLSFQSLEAHLKLYISYKWVRAQIQAPYPNLWGLEITMVLPIKVTPTAPSDVHLPAVTGFPDAPHNSYGRPCVPPTPPRANPAPPQERYTVTLYLV